MMLELDALAVGYGTRRPPVLVDLTLSARPGEFVCLLGRNGAGKSTLLRTLAGLLPPLSGAVRLGGDEVERLTPAERARRIAVVLTERVTHTGLTAGDVVALGRAPFTGWTGALTLRDASIVTAALERTAADRFVDRRFDLLSDGERQRVAIARALAQESRLLLLDEVTAFLDLPGRVDAMLLLRAQAREQRAIVVLSSHDLELALQLADTVWLIGPDGHLEAGTPTAVIASGAVNRAFDVRDVVFDAATGRFRLVG